MLPYYGSMVLRINSPMVIKSRASPIQALNSSR
jgi:hypothetical protein